MFIVPVHSFIYAFQFKDAIYRTHVRQTTRYKHLVVESISRRSLPAFVRLLVELGSPKEPRLWPTTQTGGCWAHWSSVVARSQLLTRGVRQAPEFEVASVAFSLGRILIFASESYEVPRRVPCYCECGC